MKFISTHEFGNDENVLRQEEVLSAELQEAEISSLPAFNRGRAVGVIGVLTVVVAIAGYLREAALASRFGISTTMDAYFGAIFVPNIVYFVLIAGTFSPIFIPILLQDHPRENPEKASQTFSAITNFTLLVLVAIVFLGLLGAHQWLAMLFPGFSPATIATAVHLVYIVFPALLFLGIAGILTAVLNGFHKFWVAAVAPALSSLAVIAGVFLARGDRAVYVIGAATALGFLLQAVLLVMATASLGIRYRPVLDIHHPAIKKLLRLGVPLFLYLTAANASVLLERNLASQLSAGAVSILTYALRLFTVPSNFLAAPLAVVAYPGFAREAARNQRGDLGNQVSRMFRLVVFLFLPITLWTVLNASPLTRLLYEHGHFVSSDSFITARVLAIYGGAVFPNAIAIVLLRCFFAIEDTITPLLAELIALGTFAATASLFARHFGIEGLAGARTFSFYIVTAVLIYVLSRRKGLLKLDLLRSGFLLRTVAASCGMGAVSWAALHFLQSAFDGGNTLLRLGIVFIVLALSGTAFLGVALLLKIGEAKQIVKTVQGWFGGTPA